MSANSESWVGFEVVADKFVMVFEKFADKLACRRPSRIFRLKWKIRGVRRTQHWQHFVSEASATCRRQGFVSFRRLADFWQSKNRWILNVCWRGSCQKSWAGFRQVCDVSPTWSRHIFDKSSAGRRRVGAVDDKIGDLSKTCRRNVADTLSRCRRIIVRKEPLQKNRRKSPRLLVATRRGREEVLDKFVNV